MTILIGFFRMLLDYILLRSGYDGGIHLKETFIAIISFIFDIVFVKQFKSDNLRPKLKWLLSSFSNFVIAKVILASMVQAVVAQTLTSYIVSTVEKSNKKFRKFKYFDLVVSAVVNLMLLGPLVFYLKFRWAYVIREKLETVDILIMTWVFTLVTLYTVVQTTNNILYKTCSQRTIPP